MNLYEINQAKLAILSQIEDLEGEMPPELEAELTKIEASLDEKLEACCCVMKNLAGVIELHESEMKRLKDRRDALEARLERLKAWTSGSVSSKGWSRGVHKLAWRKSESVEADVEKLPLDYQRVEYSPDKTKLREDLKNGATIPGARLVSKQNLQVK